MPGTDGHYSSVAVKEFAAVAAAVKAVAKAAFHG